MSDPFIGEIRLFGFPFAPRDWASCDGQLMNVSQNNALYSLLGNTYGGTAPTTFNLPDLRGRTPLHRSVDYQEGVRGGMETVALIGASQLPMHTHGLVANAVDGTTNDPSGAVFAKSKGINTPSGTNTYLYTNDKPAANLNAAALTTAGASTAHENMQPSLAINFCIALTGYYPSRP